MHTYQVKEIFGPTLQGEGFHAGWPCVFVRLSGCNAWDGRPETRADSACPYCDTDFRGGDRMSIAAILAAAQERHANQASTALGCVLTGGAPLLQADAALLQALGETYAWVDVETNGTRPATEHPDNVFFSCSPKFIPNQPVKLVPDWWKILLPVQRQFLDPALASGKPVYVQPTCPDAGPLADGNDGQAYQASLQECMQACYTHGVRLSLQTHKYLGIE